MPPWNEQKKNQPSNNLHPFPGFDGFAYWRCWELPGRVKPVVSAAKASALPWPFFGWIFFQGFWNQQKTGVVFFVGELIEQIRSHTVSYQEQKRFGWLVFNPPDGKHFLQGLGSKTFSPKSLEWNHLVSAKVNGSRRLEGSQKSGEGIFALVETMIVPSEILIYSIH